MTSGAGLGPAADGASQHTDRVAGSFAGADPRFAEVMRAAVRHLHAFAEEVGLSREEWMSGIRFLTEVGRRCDESRQEFILLSDTLGLSMLIEMLVAPPAPGATEPTVVGPFHVADVAEHDNGSSIVAISDTGGVPLAVNGRVSDIAGRPVPDATVDVWQVQPDGRYDVEDDPRARNLRARLRTGADGGFRFDTVRPVDYTIPGDGPVGSMLSAAGRHRWRPAHIHFAVAADGYRPLVTHLFDSASPYLGSDAVFAVRPSLIVDMDGPACDIEIVLQPADS